MFDASISFPGESDAYREARNELLQAELDLRTQLEKVAALRRELPPGGPLKEDYVFEELNEQVVVKTKMSELFAPGKNSLVVYSFMFAPNADQPCPMCNSILDGLNGQTQHVTQRANLVVVAKAPIEKLSAWAASRGWQNLRLLSSYGNDYNRDYYGENEGHQMPNCNVFVKTESGIRHFYASEVLYAGVEGQPRHVDLLWPLWNVLDLTPEGRGSDWMPKLAYD